MTGGFELTAIKGQLDPAGVARLHDDLFVSSDHVLFASVEVAGIDARAIRGDGRPRVVAGVNDDDKRARVG